MNKLRIVLALGALAAGMLYAQQDRKADESILFAVEGSAKPQYTVVIPIALVRGAEFSQLPYACTADADTKNFQEKYLAKGRDYDVFFGGAPAGKVEISTDFDASPDLEVKLASTSRFVGSTMALATNSIVPKDNAAKRRTGTAAERLAIKRPLTESLKVHNVNLSTLDILADNYIAAGTYLGSDEKHKKHSFVVEGRWDVPNSAKITWDSSDARAEFVDVLPFRTSQSSFHALILQVTRGDVHSFLIVDNASGSRIFESKVLNCGR